MLGEGAALLLGVLFLGFLYGPTAGGASQDQIVLRIVMPVWILAVALVSWLLIRGWTWLVKNPRANVE
jgi:hypothetical protein